MMMWKGEDQNHAIGDRFKCCVRQGTLEAVDADYLLKKSWYMCHLNEEFEDGQRLPYIGAYGLKGMLRDEAKAIGSDPTDVPEMDTIEYGLPLTEFGDGWQMTEADGMLYRRFQYADVYVNIGDPDMATPTENNDRSVFVQYPAKIVSFRQACMNPGAGGAIIG
jgi:hypothetical protein